MVMLRFRKLNCSLKWMSFPWLWLNCLQFLIAIRVFHCDVTHSSLGRNGFTLDVLMCPHIITANKFPNRFLNMYYIQREILIRANALRYCVYSFASVNLFVGLEFINGFMRWYQRCAKVFKRSESSHTKNDHNTVPLKSIDDAHQSTHSPISFSLSTHLRSFVYNWKWRRISILMTRARWITWSLVLTTAIKGVHGYSFTTHHKSIARPNGLWVFWQRRPRPLPCNGEGNRGRGIQEVNDWKLKVF